MPARPFVCKVCRNGNNLTVGIPAIVAKQRRIQRGDWYGITVIGKSIVYTQIDNPKSFEKEAAEAVAAVGLLDSLE